MTMNGHKARSVDVEVQLPETKVAAETTTMSGPLVTGRPDPKARYRMELLHVLLRLACVVTSVTALSFMMTAKQASTISIYGFHLPVSSKWSFSDSFEYLVGVTAAVAAHSILQLLISGSRLLRKSPVIPSQGQAWLIFAGDQAFAYALISAGSAASGVTNLNRTGIRHSALPNFCKPLHSFCDHVAVSVSFTFLSWFLLATSSVLHVIWLWKN
ncbi:Casparian strip membrane protein domain [Dillenia turbinata]|uniref:CASP-like protein n=1 Tax=Dillenia turbinata TaxID=194707 RepID=A0AAN8URL4_9MAGN